MVIFYRFKLLFTLLFIPLIFESDIGDCFGIAVFQILISTYSSYALSDTVQKSIITSGMSEMEEILLVCGKWKFEKTRWVFRVDEDSGCRMLYANENTSYEDFVAMVYEDFAVDDRKFDVRLSYMLRKSWQKIPLDTPPVFVTNARQLMGYLRQAKGESVRMCVQIEDITRSAFIGEDDKDAVRRKLQKETEDCIGVSVPGKKDKDEEYYIRKRAGKKHVDSEPAEHAGEGKDEGYADDDKYEDEDEEYRFDYCDDIDGASSGDEDYCLYAKYSEEVEEDEEEVKEEVKEEVEDVMVRTPQKGFAHEPKNSATGKELIKLEVGAVDVAVGQRFETKEALETRVKILSVLQKFDFNVERSRPKLYIVSCWIPGCTWRIRASTIGDSTSLCIRIYVRDHTCSVTERSARARQATPDILGQLYKDFVGGIGEGVLPAHVGYALNLRFGIQVLLILVILVVVRSI